MTSRSWYDRATLERVVCNCCGADTPRILARRASGGRVASTNLCKSCGLIYLSPRMSAASYDRYYREFYRIDRSSNKAEEDGGLESLFRTSRRYGEALSRQLREFFGKGLVLDVGSSTGGVLTGVKGILGLPALGIEPSSVEADFARAKGIETITSLFEVVDPHTLPRPSTIICTQSLNHLLDPRAFLERSWELLPDGGHLVLAVKNFRHQVRRAGGLEASVQIDHPYMFTPEVLRAFVLSVGFRIVYLDVDERKSKQELARQHAEGLSRSHIRLVARKDAAQKNMVTPQNRLRAMLLALAMSPLMIKAHHLVSHSRFSARISRMLDKVA